MEPPNKKTRKPNWTEEQNLLLTRLVEQNKAILLGKFGPGVTAQKKKEKWAEVTAEINSTFPNVTRSIDEVEKKWHNIQSKAKYDISVYKRSSISTGGGPSCPSLSAVNEVVRDILGNDNMVISGVPNSTDSSMLQVLEMPEIEESSPDTMTELDLRTLQALSGIQVLPLPRRTQPSEMRSSTSAATPSATSSTATSSTATSSATFQRQLCPRCQNSGNQQQQEALSIEKLKLEVEILKLRKRLLMKELKDTGEE